MKFKYGILRGAQPLEILLRLVLVGVGCLLTVFVLWMAVQNVIVIRTHEPTKAEVLVCERIGPVASKGVNRFFVQVRYVGPDGNPKTAEVDYPTTKYEVGDIIDIYYKPESSYKVIAAGIMEMWFLPAVIGTIALVMLFFGLKGAARRS